MKLKLTLLALAVVCTAGLVSDFATPTAEAQPCLIALNRCCLPAYAAFPGGTSSCPVGRPCVISPGPSCSGTTTEVATPGSCKPENNSTCSICPNDTVAIGIQQLACQRVVCDHPCYFKCEWAPTGVALCCVTVQECRSTKCSTFTP